WTFSNLIGDTRGMIPVGKLRIAYGQTGQIPPVYSTIGGLTTGAFVDGWVSDGLSTSQSGIGGLTTSTLKAQPNLGPEISKELEGGADLALWRNYADIGITFYNSKTEGVILLTPLPPSTGFTQQASNAARIRNTGTELTLNLRPVQNPSFGWDVGLQWGKNNNKVLDLAGSEYIDVAGGSFTGASGTAWNGTKGALYFFGKAKDTDFRNVTATFGTNYMPAHPGASGVVAGPGAGTPVVIDQGWYQGDGGGFGEVSAQFIEDASFAKLRELSLSYNWKTPFLNRSFGFESVDLRVAGRNLHTWTKYTGIDPETNLAGAEVLVRGIDYFNNPQTRSVVFSIGLNR